MSVTNLIKLNVIFGLGFFVLMVLSQRYTSILLVLLGLPFLGGFFGLALANVFGIFYCWKRNRSRAFLPIVVYALIVLLGRICVPPATQLLVEGTPGHPDSFLTDENRAALEDISDDLLKGSFKEILTFDDKATEITMIAGYSKRELPSGLSDQLRKFEIERSNCDL